MFRSFINYLIGYACYRDMVFVRRPVFIDIPEVSEIMVMIRELIINNN
jgi:hypothetical protein